MEKRLNRWLLVFLVFAGFLLRVYKISSYPPLIWDEASLGYNAYSILKTGRDEYGKFLPLIFKSFGDYKPGLYVYLTVPFVAIFGLNEFAVRLPAVIFGSLTPVFFYLLIKELFAKKKPAFLSALALAFLPWHIHFSRGAWESNLLTFFLVLAAYFFTRTFKRKNANFNFLLLFLIAVLLSLWVYQGAKMLTPLIVFGLLFFNKRYWTSYFKAKKSRPGLILGLAIAAVFFLIGSWYWQSFSGKSSNRLKVMSLFSYARPVEEISRVLSESGTEEKNLHFYLFHGEWLRFFRGFLLRYFNYFSARFLSFEGDWTNPRHSAPYFGVIGHVNFILFILGLTFFLARERKRPRYFLVYWLLCAPLPAALSRDIITGVRSLSMAVPISFFIGYGLSGILELKAIELIRKAIFFALILFALFDFVYYWDLYYHHMVIRSPKEWLYGHKEVINFVRENQSENQKVLMTNFYGQPYIYYLFYSKYLPLNYQKQASLKESVFGDVGQVERVDNIFFNSLSWQADSVKKDSLVIFSEDEILRSGVENDQSVMKELRPLGRIGGLSTFYGFGPVEGNE
ncbi:glycosyltransferase family 39 protein [Patescibacteria group bacterium]|nr:glycosyltransferase family 39 protein [Patescibacteria group bacterium]